ncbi:hypothetical protein UG55_108420 [Frankia sp. EI5c]|uniref:hypothetical protein n=1 Tax=Frankia sp. EI5c TaxID=683316 RepID=UPI0007C2C5C6|nr:hypothetical protein [Frankia sp. EI5c]OAA19869.1 hypothetical protein UG55_108420 [Frankia sp. EI5c]
MSRFYDRRPLWPFTWWMVGTMFLVLFLTGFQWFVVHVLPAMAPFLIVGFLVIVVVWGVHRLRG